MFNELWEMGITQGLGIFFFLFLVVAFVLWKFVNQSIDANNKFVAKVMLDNLIREGRYLDTIDTLSDSNQGFEQLKTEICNMRENLEASHERCEKMWGKVLDRLAAKV